MQFVCRVGTPDGRVLEEVMSAGDEASLRNELAKRGYHIFEVRRRGVPRKLGASAGGLRKKKIPDEALMVKRLPGYSPDLAGRIVYPAAFDALGY